MKIGQNLEWEKTMSSPQPNLIWFATCTHDITITLSTSPAPAIQKK